MTELNPAQMIYADQLQIAMNDWQTYVHEAAQVNSNQRVNQLQSVVANSTIAAVPANYENILVDNSINDRLVASVAAQTATFEMTEHAHNLRKWKALKYDQHIDIFTAIFNKLYPDVFPRFQDTVAGDLLLQQFYIQKLPQHLFLEISRRGNFVNLAAC
jgi:hypothetical protein